MSYITLENNAPDWAHRLLAQINKWFSAVAIFGGTINGTTVGLTTPAAAAFTTTQVAGLTSTQTITAPGGASLIATTAALTNNAAAQAATIANSPTAGNPTKWVAINDAGTTRYLPLW